MGGAVPAAAFAAVPLLAQSPGGIAAINAAIASMGSLGTFVGGPLGAWAQDRFGGPGLAVAALVAMALSMVAFRRADRPHPAAA
jgi:hypothetical protein